MKGIIFVDDYPNSCVECEFAESDLTCKLEGRIPLNENEGEKPDWCPIHEFDIKLSPNKPGEKSKYSQGWDDCLKQIGFSMRNDERYKWKKLKSKGKPKTKADDFIYGSKYDHECDNHLYMEDDYGDGDYDPLWNEKVEDYYSRDRLND